MDKKAPVDMSGNRPAPDNATDNSPAPEIATGNSPAPDSTTCNGPAPDNATDNSPAPKHKPHYLVFANEKGGTGKSTTAIHMAIALCYLGYRVAMIDMDPRQRTSFRYLENRLETMRRLGINLPMPAFHVFEGECQEELDAMIAAMSENCEILIFDTPGRHDEFGLTVATRADTLVTPLNDSFVDFDLLGQVDPVTFKIKKLSFYADLIWTTRMKRARAEGKEMDWVVLRNRTRHIEAHNMRRVDQALDELSKRVGFRYIPGLSERVIYRELFPAGLTLLDKDQMERFGPSHIQGRQELRAMLRALKLPERLKEVEEQAPPSLTLTVPLPAAAENSADVRLRQIPKSDRRSAKNDNKARRYLFAK